MISQFLNKLLMTRQASFTEDEIEILDLNFNMQPLMSLVAFQKETQDFDAVEKLGYFISEAMIQHFKKRLGVDDKKIAKIWTNLFNISGFGKLEVVTITDSVSVLKIAKSNFAKLYLSKYGTQKKPVCHIITGILKNFIERVYDKKVDCKETSCIAMGNKVCSFEVKPIR